MKCTCLSLASLVATSGFLFAGGADADTPPRKIDPLQAANDALQAKTVKDGWVPAIGDSWNYNLMTPVQTAVDVDVVMIDMDGAQATIDDLHSEGKRVVCYISIGTVENWRVDAGDFPDEAIGSPMGDWGGERWLDITNEEVKKVMRARVVRAEQMQCDGIEPDNMNVYMQEGTGLPITMRQQIAYNKWFAKTVQARGMKVALKNNVDILSTLVDDFDFAINESCYDWNECDDYATTFIAQGKPVFNVEYANNLDICGYANNLGMDTIIKDYDLTGKFCSCVDSSRDVDCNEVI